MPKLILASQLFIGIDPGVNGGIALVSGAGKVLDLYSMPQSETDTWELLNLTGLHNCPRLAVVEWIHPSIQGIKKSAMSKLYGNYSGCRMALVAAGIPFEAVMAAKWQRAMGITPRGKTETQSKWKNRLRARAQQLFPKSTITLKTADALLIAEFCRRFHQGMIK